jgi:hypothetical protein
MARDSILSVSGCPETNHQGGGNVRFCPDPVAPRELPRFSESRFVGEGKNVPIVVIGLLLEIGAAAAPPHAVCR